MCCYATIPILQMRPVLQGHTANQCWIKGLKYYFLLSSYSQEFKNRLIQQQFDFQEKQLIKCNEERIFPTTMLDHLNICKVEHQPISLHIWIEILNESYP